MNVHLNCRYFVFILFLSCTINGYAWGASANGQSHTMFIPRQVTTNSVFELGLNNYQWYHERTLDDHCKVGVYITPFFQQTVKQEKIARYFLRNNQESLVFREINENPCDICSLWFGVESDLNSNFISTFSMSPRRRTVGSYFSIYFAKKWQNHYVWLNIAFAAMRAEHELRMNEHKQELVGPLSHFELGTLNQFASVISALQNPEWCFGKFSGCTLKQGGIDDIQLKLGSDCYYSNHNDIRVSPYVTATIPTGKQQRAEFIFEPLVGSKNGSIGAGVNTDFLLYSYNDHSINLLLDVKYRFVFSAHQYRSFDLCANGDWSRYLLVVPQNQHLATEPGINVLSLKTKIRPGNTIDAWGALHWQWNNCNGELGYNFWWRQKEKIWLLKDSSLRKNIENGFGIFDLAGADGVPQSASKANISESVIGSNKAPSDQSFVTLTTCDLNLDSASHPSALSSTLYTAFSWQPTPGGYPLLIGLGVQYEFAHKITALEQWAVWGKCGLIF